MQRWVNFIELLEIHPENVLQMESMFGLEYDSVQIGYIFHFF